MHQDYNSLKCNLLVSIKTSIDKKHQVPQEDTQSNKWLFMYCVFHAKDGSDLDNKI